MAQRTGPGTGTGKEHEHEHGSSRAIARGSATESAAILDVLLARGLVHPLTYRHCRALLVRVIQMTTKLNASLT